MPCSTVACILESKWFAIKLFLTPNLKKIFERGGGGVSIFPKSTFDSLF